MADTILQSKRDKFLSTYRNQTFSIPTSIVHYIAKNPSNQDTYDEMIQCCKYFFIKNPIIPLTKLSMRDGWLRILCNSHNTTKLWVVGVFSARPFTIASYQNLFSKVISSNDKEVEIEKLVHVCSNASMFEYAFSSNPSNFSSNSIEELLQIPQFLNLDVFGL
uniref:Uncharacterized protein n=1 Tax=Panagrolaimus sp. ES5 TaxID=591445 RepID=A0AC34FXG0_9BILA